MDDYLLNLERFCMRLRDYQKVAITKIRLSFQNGNRSILVVSPTGSGKGVILSEIIKTAASKGKNVLFLVHRREILFQVSTYLENYDIPHGVILSGEEYTGGHLVEVATVQTLRSRMKRRSYKKADVIIIDEAHNSTAKTYTEVIDAHRENLIIGFTATPCRQSGKGLGTLYDDLVNVATIDELTKAGFLVPIKYYAPNEPDLSKIKITAGEYNLKQLDKKMMEPKLIGDIIENWARLADNRQTVVFTTTVAHSVAVCEAFKEVGIIAEHIDGGTDKQERSEILYRFRAGDTNIICNCAVLTEGIDIPDISCVVMARPTKSLALYMQTIGRGMRPAPGKTDMTYIDHSGACYEHGPVDEMTEWTLDEETKNGNKKNEDRKKRKAKPIECQMCSLIYTGQIKCPQCGTIPDIKQYGKDVEYIDADLGEVCFKSKTVKVKATMEDKKEWYSQLSGHARQKGYKSGWISHKYREKFGVWPNKINEHPKTPSIEVLAWLRGKAAQHAIARKHEAKNG
jgi:superfamily II DNA or RNA helicase